MKHFSLFCLVAFLLPLTGCKSIRSKVHDRFVPPVYQAKTVALDQRKAYEVARAALVKMDFRFERGGPAQGVIHAVGPMHPGTSASSSARQLWFDAKLSPENGGGTKIEVLFSELVEDDFDKHPGQGELTPLRDSPIYEAYFHYIDELLAAKP